MKRFSKFLVWNVILVLFDQLTKYMAQTKLMGTDGISLIDGVFRLQYLENRGAAFGSFQNKIIFLVIITIAIFSGIVYVYTKLPEQKRYFPLQYLLIFISAGAIGNFLDRLINNYVIDFLYFEWIDFPIFNVADCYVTISAVILFILGIFYYKDEDFEFLKQKKDVTHGK
ncbi:MAG: signal peptidase II [Acetivibrio sp.]